MAISRNQENYIVMSVIYMELNDFNYGDKSLSTSSKELMNELLEDYNESSPSNYVEDLINLSLFHYGEIKDIMSSNLNNWKWERLPLLTQSILLMSYTRYKYLDKPHKAVVIDVAVSLAKTYIEESQAKFINAILDKVLD